MANSSPETGKEKEEGRGETFLRPSGEKGRKGKVGLASIGVSTYLRYLSGCGEEKKRGKRVECPFLGRGERSTRQVKVAHLHACIRLSLGGKEGRGELGRFLLSSEEEKGKVQKTARTPKLKPSTSSYAPPGGEKGVPSTFVYPRREKRKG